MKVPICRIYSVGEITSWAKTFLNSVQKESLCDVTFENSVQRFCVTSSTQIAIVFIENAPDMRQAILKVRQSGRACLVVWYGKLFSKEDMVFAHENRVYLILENPRVEDKRVLDGVKRVARCSENVLQFSQHLHSLKAILLQGEEDEQLKPLVAEFKPALAKIERTGLHNEFLGAIELTPGDQERLPFHRSQDLADALITVHDLERTGSLWVRGNLPGQEGKVEFLQGKLVSAVAGSVRGLKAIYRMFLWDEPRFLFTRIDPQEYVFEDHLNVSLKYLCMEADELRQRFTNIRRDIPPPELELELEPSAIHADTQLSPDDFSTLASVVEFNSVAEVVDFNALPDVAIYEALIRLRKNNMIRVATK